MTSSAFHPDLRGARWLPRGVGSPLTSWLERHAPARLPEPPVGFTYSERRVAPHGPRVLILRPTTSGIQKCAALLYIHGGGYVMGRPERDFSFYAELAVQLQLVVVAVDYRLAPEHPYPAPLDDCFAAFEYMHNHAASLGIDPARIIITGVSAGGGLAAALTLRIHDLERPPPLLQHLVYPMLDDRSTGPNVERRFHRLWNRASNVYGWRSYLGGEPGGAGISEYAAPARRRDLAGLPPAWIGVGTLDLFYDEDVLYAKRLRSAGVATTLEVVEGAFHGFDVVMPRAPVSRQFVMTQIEALRRRLGGSAGTAELERALGTGA